MPSLSHVNPPKQLCCCEARKCNTFVDGNGTRGVLLDRMIYSRHQRAERSRKIKEEGQNRANAAELSRQDPDIYGALPKQAAVLAAREREIADALSGLSLQDHHPPLAEQSLSPAEHPFSIQSKYRIQRERDMADYFSRLAADVHAHIQQVQAFEMPPVSQQSDADIQNALQACSNARGFITGTRQRLVWTEKGLHRRDPTVKYQREEIRQMLSGLADLVQKVDSMWGIFHDKRTAEVAKIKMKSASEYNSAHHFKPILADSSPIVQIIVFMVVVGHVILGYSQRGCRWLFSMGEFIIQTTVMAADPENRMSHYFKALFKLFPRDVRTATEQFKLEGKATIFAVCTACDSIYEPAIVDKIPSYPERCKNRIYGSQCGTLLVRPKVIQKRKIFVPIKTFVSFDFNDWMGNLLSRTDYESKMDAAWSRMAPSETGHVTDIFQGSRILGFKGRDGKHFSKTGEKDAGRYLFSLGFDFFNPLRNLAAGKKISIGVLALICLNLPIEIRYKPENVFLAGIIPGPKEPSLDAVNPYLKPIVDVFLIFWVGVYFTKTFLHATGRLVICALLLLICDLPAARKAAGFSSCNHEFFCSLCWCTKTAHGYNNFNWESWKWRTDVECREHARQYSTATSKKDASSLFDLSGIRYSELHRLPYFDATKSVVVDPMHNLFLGLIKEHFQNILGYGKAKKDLPDTPTPSVDIEISPSDQNPLPKKKSEKASVRRLINWLKKPIDFDPTNETALNDTVSRWDGRKAHVAALVYVSKGVGCIPLTMTARGRNSANDDSKKLTKLDLARRLVEWRTTQVEAVPTELSKQLGKVFTAEEMAELVRVIENMVKPSWVTSVPTTMSSNGPKLKSDQWRIAGQLYLPVALIRLWSKPDDEESGQKYGDLLHLTMSLFSAINVATSRITSRKNADRYLSLMITYRQELKRLFPHYECHPNHHMALHIPEFIKEYGPVHGWWTFPFERMIGTLQRIPTNYHAGEYEETISRTWYRRSNLRALFQKKTCPKAIQLCREMFDKLVHPLIRNSLANAAFQDQEEEEYFDITAEKEISVKLSEQARSAFRKKLKTEVRQPGQARARLHAHGVDYTTHPVHEGNSGVFFRGSDVPFRIEEILEFSEPVGGELSWIVARPHQQAQVNSDPYAKYPHLRAKMWSASFSESVQVFPLSALDSHFAKCVVPWEGKEVAVCVSLSRSQLD